MNILRMNLMSTLTRRDQPPMDRLAQYGSDSEDNNGSTTATNRTTNPAEPDSSKQLSVTKRPKIDLAPAVPTQDLATFAFLPADNTKEITFNVPVHDLEKPIQGPSNPFVASKSITNRNTMTGFVEKHNMSEQMFDALQRTYTNFGYTLDPDATDANQFVGDKEQMQQKQGALVSEMKRVPKSQRKKRKAGGGAEDVDGFLGPWAGYEDEEAEDLEPAADQDAWTPEPTAAAAAAEDSSDSAKKESTIFHGKFETDYAGRTYMHVPTDAGVDLNSEPGSFKCFMPKKLIHTWTGHTKAVNAIRYFPNSAHLLLSASMDNKVKLWDVYHDRRCLRTYMGHTKGVRDITFSNDGRRFLTASMDRWIKLWDTETGQCISRYTTKRTPYCIKFNPDEDKQNFFLVGCQDRKVYQFDTKTGEIEQEYNQHLGAVNTITFVDNNRRFVTTSDDKTLRAWEFGIPVVIKYVADPSMFSMPAVSLSMNKKWLACQSLDNQIMIYSARDRFRLNSKKVFKGHLVAGYACQPNFSPDSQYVISGDSNGMLWVWDWKTCRALKKIKAHEGVVMGCEWHPHETSKVATCSWDGTIKFWD